MKDLKLFVWENVLRHHSYGVMFALAVDLERAKELIIEAEGGGYQLMFDLEKPHRIIEIEEGFFNYGGM